MDKRQIGPFLLEEQIGVGGMGVVYRATYPKNDKKVAVKILSPGLMADAKLLSRFEREIKILKRLNHPNIVKYYGGGTENNQRYYAMQFIDGGSLQDVLKKRGRLTWEQAIHVGRQVCSALEHAHNAGIIHRDLKPANLFLSRKGRLMLGDFGIARDTEATALTAAGKTVGTYAYMAPEQINGSHPISGRTDLYALGCLMYEILVGETPFIGDNPADMLMQHLNDDPHNVTEFAPDCPIWLDKLIERMLEKNPEDRPFDALAVHTELGEIRDKIAAGNSVAAVATAPAGQIATQDEKQKLREALGKKKKKKKRRNVPFHERPAFLVSCLVVLAGLTTWLVWPDSPEELFLKASAVMEHGDRTERREALDKYIIPALEADPEGPNVGQLIEWHDEIKLDILSRQMNKRVQFRLGKVEKQVEFAFIGAMDLENDHNANPLVAVERYHQGIDMLDAYTPQQMEQDKLTSDDCRVWTALFVKRRDDSRAAVLERDNLRELLQQRMQRAEELLQDGKGDEAARIWDATASLYQNIDRIADFQRYAQRRSNGLDAMLPSLQPQPIEEGPLPYTPEEATGDPPA